MYSLRTVHTRSGAETNILLGISYTFNKYEEYNADESMFNNIINTRQSKGGEFMPKSDLKKYVQETKHYAIINGDGVEIDLFNDGERAYYIMLNGSTYANLTKR